MDKTIRRIAAIVLFLFAASAFGAAAQEATTTAAEMPEVVPIMAETPDEASGEEVEATEPSSAGEEPADAEAMADSPETLTPETAGEPADMPEEEISPEDLGVEEPQMLPDSPFYFLKNWGRNIRLAVTFDKVKKAERRLQYANERLVEARELAEETGKEEIVEKAMEKYEKDVEKATDRIEKIREKAEENPKIDRFLDKLADHEIKRQKLIHKIEERIPEKIEKIEKIRKKSIEKFGKTLAHLEEKEEKIAERLEKAMEKQEKVKFKNFHNLEVLKELEEKIPEKAKNGIIIAQRGAIKRLRNEIKDMREENREEELGEFLAAASGNEARHLEILEDLKNEETSAEIIDLIDKAKEKPIMKLEKRLREIPSEEGREEFLRHLQDGEMHKMRIIKEMEDSLPPEAMEKIQVIKKKAYEKFEEKIAPLVKDPEKRREFFENMPPPPIHDFEIMDEMEEIMDPDNIDFMRMMKERSFDKFKEEMEGVENDPEMREVFFKRIAPPMEPEDPGARMNKIRVIKELESSLPDDMRHMLGPMMEMATEKVRDKLEEMTPEERDELIAATVRADISELGTIEELEKALPPQIMDIAEKMKIEALRKMGEGREKYKDNPEEYERFLEKTSSDDPRHIETLKRVHEKLEGKLPEQARAPEMLERILDKQKERIGERIERFEDEERLREFKKEIEGDWQLKKEMMEKDPEFFKRIDYRKDYIKNGHDEEMKYDIPSEKMKEMEYKKMDFKEMKEQYPEKDLQKKMPEYQEKKYHEEGSESSTLRERLKNKVIEILPFKNGDANKYGDKEYDQKYKDIRYDEKHEAKDYEGEKEPMPDAVPDGRQGWKEQPRPIIVNEPMPDSGQDMPIVPEKEPLPPEMQDKPMQ